MPLIDLDQANAFETAALPGSGDTDAGAGGLTTSTMASETNLEAYGLDTYSQSGRGGGGIGHGYDPPSGARHLMPGMAADLHGSPADHPFWTIALIGAGLFVYKAVTRNEASENVKVSIPSFIAVGLMATGFILGEKWLFGIWQLPSITPTMDYL
jgi:hypothetical protein